ncbi:MAG: LysR family transcriptional regulator [Acidaminococcaceae bacterium]|jgi:DNA-binding transcriptional LysR family regulator|nr:LysR family transcriptional regulator [Acidaminococcaceae bacterium]
MDFSYYRNFVVIVETGSLSAAAEKLCLAQSALSNQVRHLEEEYGAKLLLMGRGQRTLDLTDAGRVFFKQAQYLCAVEDTTRTEIKNCAAGLAGLLKLSVSTALAPHFVRHDLQGFIKLYPQVRYQVYEAPVLDQIRQLNEGMADVGVANAPLPEPHQFRILARTQQSFYVVGRKNNPWLNGQAETYTCRDLRDAPLCANFVSQPLITEACEAYDFVPRILLGATTRNTPLALASCGLALAVVNLEGPEEAPEGCFAVRLDEKSLYIEQKIYTLKKKILPSLVQKFVDYVEANNHAEQTGTDGQVTLRKEEGY